MHVHGAHGVHVSSTCDVHAWMNAWKEDELQLGPGRPMHIWSGSEQQSEHEGLGACSCDNSHTSTHPVGEAVRL